MSTSRGERPTQINSAYGGGQNGEEGTDGRTEDFPSSPPPREKHAHVSFDFAGGQRPPRLVARAADEGRDVGIQGNNIRCHGEAVAAAEAEESG